MEVQRVACGKVNFILAVESVRTGSKMVLFTQKGFTCYWILAHVMSDVIEVLMNLQLESKIV